MSNGIDGKRPVHTEDVTTEITKNIKKAQAGLKKAGRKTVVGAAAATWAVSTGVGLISHLRISEDEAVKRALKEARLNKHEVSSIKANEKVGKYVVKFISLKRQAKYEYEFSKSGKLLREFVEYSHFPNPSKDQISKLEAQKIVSRDSKVRVPVINLGTFKYDYRRGTGTFELKFKLGHYRYEYVLLAPNGKIIKSEKKYV